MLYHVLNTFKTTRFVKLQLHDAIYRLRFYSNSLIHILSLSNSHNNIASLQKNRGDKSHRVIVALEYVEQDNSFMIICHYSVCVIYDLSKVPVSYKLCFLSEERLFSLIAKFEYNYPSKHRLRACSHDPGTTHCAGVTH